MVRMAKRPARMERLKLSALFVLLGLIFSALSTIAHAQTGQGKSQARVLSEAEMLMAGVQANRVDVVVYLLNKGLDPDTTVRNGYTALFVAAARGHTGIADLLLARGADVNKANDAGWTALMEAALHDQDKMVKHLIKAGARLDISERVNGLTPLMVAAKGDRTGSVTAMLAAGADPKAADSKRGLSALHYALASAKHSSAEIAAELLVLGADPEHKAKDGYTPLMSAVDSGKIAKISLVLSESVNVDAETADGRRALTLAAGNGHHAMVKRLFGAGAKLESGSGKLTALTQAIRAGADETVKLLLEQGANPNRAAADGRPPPMAGCRSCWRRVAAMTPLSGNCWTRALTSTGATGKMGQPP